MSPRRSGRLSASTQPKPKELPAESATDPNERPRKKQHKTQNADSPEMKKRPRGGKLKKLTEMPLDILFEV